MHNIHVETIRLRTCDCDMYGAWRPSAILETMQETAGVHSALLGLDCDTMNGMNLAWVVSRLKVEMLRMPRFTELLTVETYPTPQKHLFFPRTHIFRDESGAVIGSANSLWVLLDIQSRRVTLSEGVSSRMPDHRDLSSPLGLPATVRALAGDAEIGRITPRFTDFDTNHHVNNTKYLDWCLNALGFDTLKESYIKALDINYIHEILPGGEVRTELVRGDGRFTFLGFEGEKSLFSIAGQLEKRV